MSDFFLGDRFARYGAEDFDGRGPRHCEVLGEGVAGQPASWWVRLEPEMPWKSRSNQAVLVQPDGKQLAEASDRGGIYVDVYEITKPEGPPERMEDLKRFSDGEIGPTRGHLSMTGDQAWETLLRLVDAFVIREGHCEIPSGHVEEGFRLGNWVRNVRRQGAPEVPESVRERLRQLCGWSWEGN